MVTGPGEARRAHAILGKGGLTVSPFVLLSLFLGLIFLTGGSSWGHEVQLALLRPASVLVAAWGLATMQSRHWRDYWVVWALFGGAIVLTVLHLVPLPFAWWSALPGRELVAQIDSTTGFGQQSRALSLYPDATLNALVSMVVPLAVLSLVVQLDSLAWRRLAAVILCLIAASALAGLVQLSGTELSFYSAMADTHPSGLFANRNHQAALLALALPLAALAWQGGFGCGLAARTERFGVTALILLVLPLVVVTGSRAGLLATGAGLLCSLAIVFGARERATGGQGIGMLALVIAVLAGMVALTVYAARDEAITRLAASGEDLRYPVWESIMAALPAYWPWGTGVGSYVPAYQVGEPSALLRSSFSNHAHNEWLEIAFTAGVPGLILLGLAVIAFFAAAFRAWRSGGASGILPRIGVSMIFNLAIVSSADYPLRTPILAALLMVAAIWATGREDTASGQAYG